MAALLVALIALATLAFGAVYPWGYLPLFTVAALIGAAAILRCGMPETVRPLAAVLALTWLAVALQLVPLPRTLLESISPQAGSVLRNFSLVFVSGAADRQPLSIDPARTQVAAVGLAALALYLVGLTGFAGGATLRRVPPLLAGLVLALALFGIYSREHSNRDTLVYWFWRPQDNVGASPMGPFVNRNHFGGWMVMSVCLVTGWIVGQIERARRARRERGTAIEWLSSAEANGIWTMGLAAIMGVVALFWSLSRSSIVALAVCAAAFAWLTLRRPGLGATRRAAVLSVLGVALLAGLAWRGPDAVIGRFEESANMVSRIDAWRDGWQVVRDFPVTGTGLNTYSDAMLFYQTRNRDFHLAQAHNDYLQLLAEGGLIVALPAAAAIVLLVLGVRRNLRAAQVEARGYWIRAGAAVGMLGMAVQELFEFSLQIPANALLFATLAGLALSPAQARVHPRRRPSARDTIAPS